MRLTGCLLLLFLSANLTAAEIVLRVSNQPASGSLFVQIYYDANAFWDFRAPARQEGFPIAPGADYRLRDVAPGSVVLLVFADQYNNGVLDQNFIGLPAEPIWFSNDYQPKGIMGSEYILVVYRPEADARLSR